MEYFTLTFAHYLPLWLIVIISVAAAVLLSVVYLRILRGYRDGRGTVLFALKTAALILLLFYIFRPVLGYERPVSGMPTVIVMVDTSRSMSVKDTAGGFERIAEASRLASPAGPMLTNLEEYFLVENVVFSDAAAFVYEDDIEKGFAADGEITDFSVSFKQLFTALIEPGVARGVVLLSDGIETRGSILGEYNVAVPVYAVGIGSGTETSSLVDDIALTKVVAPDATIINNQVSVKATVSVKGFASSRDKPITVTIRRGSREIAADVIKPGRRETLEAEFTFIPREVGTFRYEVAVTELEEEVIKDNNIRSFNLTVTNPKMKLLYFSGALNWDYKYLRQEFALDPNLDIVAIVRTAPGNYLVQGETEGVDFTGGIPGDLDQLCTYDVLILADVEPAVFEAGRLELLEKYVADRGKAILLIGGRNYQTTTATFAETALEKLLPVYFSRSGNRYRKEKFLPELTGAGKSHPVFEGMSDYFDAASAAGKKRVAALSGYTAFSEAKAGAEQLAVVKRPGEDDALICVVQQYGKGRSMVFSSDATWNWRFDTSASGGETLYVKFWGQAARFLAGREQMVFDPSAALNVWTDKFEYIEGDEVILAARVFDADGMFDNAATVSAAVTGPGRSGRVELAYVDGSRGEYRGLFSARDPGMYKAVYSGLTSAGDAHTEELSFSVHSRYNEFATTVTDVDFLKTLANETGGRYYNVLTAPRIAEDIRQSLTDEYERIERRVWNTWLFLVLLIGFLGAEWAYRRRMNLI